MLSISVRADVRRITRDLQVVRKRIVPQVFSMAANRAIAKVRTDSVRELSGVKGIKQKIIRGRFKTRKATRTRQTAILRLRYSRVPMIITGNARETRKGVRVGKRSVDGAFIAKGRNRRAVFRRQGDVPRFPIQEQVIPLEPEARGFTSRNMRTVGRDTFRREFRRLLRSRLKKKARRA